MVRVKKNKYIKLYGSLLLYSFLLNRYINYAYKDNYIDITKEFENERLKTKDDLSLIEIEEMYYKYFNSYKVKYNHNVGLASNSDVKKLKNIADSKTSCDYVFTGTSDDMLELIKNNTNSYIEEKSLDKFNCINPLDYDENLLLDYNSAFKILRHDLELEINKILNDKFCNSNMEDLCKMKDLVLLVNQYDRKFDENGDIIYADYNGNENRIVIYFNSIFKNRTATDVSNNLLKVGPILVHEINHMRENSCDDRKAKGQINSKISSLSSSLIESAAESAVYDESNSLFNDPFISRNDEFYYYERAFENELLLLSLTDNSTSLDDYYASMFDTDINGLLSYFNIETDEEMKSFLNILRQNDASLLRNNIAYFSSPVRAAFSDLSSSEARNIMGINWKIEILRLSLRNLIEYNMNTKEKLTKDEMLALGGIIFIVSCDGAYTTKYEPNDDFINQVITLGNEFSNYMLDEYEIPVDIVNVFTQYVTFDDILCTNPFDNHKTDLATNLITKFPKLETIVKRVTDNGYSYFEIEKNVNEHGKSLIYTK